MGPVLLLWDLAVTASLHLSFSICQWSHQTHQGVKP